MSDSDLIERLEKSVADYDERAKYVSNMGRPRTDNDHGRVAGLLDEAAARIRELEGDLKQHQELNAAEHTFMLQYRAERDAIEAVTIERCKSAALSARFGAPSGWGGDRPEGWHLDRPCAPEEAANHDNGCIDAVKAIIKLRALKPSPPAIFE